MEKPLRLKVTYWIGVFLFKLGNYLAIINDCNSAKVNPIRMGMEWVSFLPIIGLETNRFKGILMTKLIEINANYSYSAVLKLIIREK